MIFGRSSTFIKDAKKLNVQTVKQLEKQLRLFEENNMHPSLGIKKIVNAGMLWEMRINRGYRLTFEYESEDKVILRRVAKHDDALRNP